MSSSVYFAVPLMVVLAILQAAVLPRFPLLGMVPQLPLLIALAWGLLRGVNEGALWAFLAGLFLDLFSTGPMGATALAFMGSVLAATWVDRILPRNRFFMPVLLSMLATLVSLAIYLISLRLLGYQADLQLALTLLPVTFLHGALILPVYWLMVGVDQVLRPGRVKI